MKRLPAGAFFTARQGQASLKVGLDAEGNLEVESACDSIARRCIVLEEELSRLRSQAFDRKETPPPKAGWQQSFWSGTGKLLSACLALLLIRALIKRRLNGH